MRWPYSFSLIILLLALSHAPAARAAGPQTGGIHHCVDASGHPVFTDRRCADMQAVPAPTTPSPSSSAPMVVSTSGGAPSVPLAPLPVLCASSREQLRQQLVDSFAARDANRLAGLMLWRGYGKRGVVSSIESLARLMKRPLLDVAIGDGQDAGSPPEPTDIYDASQPLGDIVAAQPAPPPSRVDDDRLTVETASDDGSGEPRQTHFAIARQSGCFWLRRLD